MLCAECGKPATAYLKGDGKTKLYLCAACYEKHTNKQSGTSVYSCGVCGTTMESFKKTGLVGCPQCYETFRAALLPTIKKIQGRLQHVGKCPYDNPEGDDSIELEQKSLETLLEHAIRDNNLAKAEELTAELKELKRLARRR